jgi:hypothetical protein
MAMVLTLKAYGELLRFEILHRFGGFKKVYQSVRNTQVVAIPDQPEIVAQVCEAVTLAGCFFWKPVLCFPRAVATTRLLRRHGVKAEMVIGYRPAPFFSHAWVEVDGKIVNDSPEYQKRLLVLDRL